VCIRVFFVSVVEELHGMKNVLSFLIFHGSLPVTKDMEGYSCYCSALASQRHKSNSNSRALSIWFELPRFSL
jgi:hypothetical protein